MAGVCALEKRAYRNFFRNLLLVGKDVDVSEDCDGREADVP